MNTGHFCLRPTICLSPVIEELITSLDRTRFRPNLQVRHFIASQEVLFHRNVRNIRGKKQMSAGEREPAVKNKETMLTETRGARIRNS